MQGRSGRRLESSIDGKKSEKWFKEQDSPDSRPSKQKSGTISYDIDPREPSQTSRYNKTPITNYNIAGQNPEMDQQ